MIYGIIPIYLVCFLATGIISHYLHNITFGFLLIIIFVLTCQSNVIDVRPTELSLWSNKVYH